MNSKTGQDVVLNDNDNYVDVHAAPHTTAEEQIPAVAGLSAEQDPDEVESPLSTHSGVLFYDELRSSDDVNGFNEDVCIFTSSGNEVEEESESTMAPIHLSFAGCGFLGIYHLGVALSLARHGRRLLERVHRFAGASAGALAASAIAVTGANTSVLENCVDFVYGLGEKVNKKPLGVLTPGVSLLEPLETFLDQTLPQDAHSIASGKLFISLTNGHTRKNELISQFETREDLLKCLMGTSYIPFVTGLRSSPVVWRGNKYLDGGMTNNLPIFRDGRTVLISPFSGRQDIHPTDKAGPNLHVNLLKQDFKVSAKNIVRGYHALAPPKKKKLTAYYERGFSDATRFLKKEGFYDE